MRAWLMMGVVSLLVGGGVGCVSANVPAPQRGVTVEALKARVAVLEARQKWLKNQFKAQQQPRKAACPEGYELEGVQAGRVLCVRMVVSPMRAPLRERPKLWQSKPGIWPSGCNQSPDGERRSCEGRPIRVWSSMAHR